MRRPGRAYTIADQSEAFMFQLARGRHYMGARVPDDAIAVMPNHFNLHGLNDYPEQFYPADLVTYAVSRGWYKPAKDGDFSDFDFAKAYQAEDEFFGRATSCARKTVCASRWIARGASKRRACPSASERTAP